jgi:quercetin dioxygenase-like cupin family protein
VGQREYRDVSRNGAPEDEESSAGRRKMDVVRTNDLKEEIVDNPSFTGPVRTRSHRPSEGWNVGVVHFPDGVRNRFHTHSSDQILIVTGGAGVVATSDEEVRVGPGDVIVSPGDVPHWHGALPGHEFTHITLLKAGTTTVFDEEHS